MKIISIIINNRISFITMLLFYSFASFSDCSSDCAPKLDCDQELSKDIKKSIVDTEGNVLILCEKAKKYLKNKELVILGTKHFKRFMLESTTPFNSAPEEIKNNPEVLKEVLRYDDLAIHDVTDKEMLNDKEIATLLLKINPKIIIHLSDKFQNDNDIKKIVDEKLELKINVKRIASQNLEFEYNNKSYSANYIPEKIDSTPATKVDGRNATLSWDNKKGHFIEIEGHKEVIVIYSTELSPIDIEAQNCIKASMSRAEEGNCISKQYEYWEKNINALSSMIQDNKLMKKIHDSWIIQRQAFEELNKYIYENRDGNFWVTVAVNENISALKRYSSMLSSLVFNLRITEMEIKERKSLYQVNEKKEIDTSQLRNDELVKLLDAYSSLAKKDAQTLNKFKKLYDIYEKIRKSDSGDGKITYGLGFLFKKLLIANSVDIPLNGVYLQNKKINGEWQNINCTKYKKLTGDSNKCGSWLPKKSQIIKLVEYSMNNKSFKGEKLYILKDEESKWLKKYFNFDCSLQDANNDAEKSFISSLCN